MSDDENYEEDFDYGEEFDDDNDDQIEQRSERNLKDDISNTNEDDDDDEEEDQEDEPLSANEDSAPTSPMNQASYERLDPSTRIIASNEDRLRQGTSGVFCFVIFHTFALAYSTYTSDTRMCARIYYFHS